MGANTSKVNVESTSNDQGQEQSFYAERPVRVSGESFREARHCRTPGIQLALRKTDLARPRHARTHEHILFPLNRS